MSCRRTDVGCTAELAHELRPYPLTRIEAGVTEQPVHQQLTAASFLETLRARDAFETMWGPALDFSVEAGAMPGFPRLLNPGVTFDRISENGEFVPTGDSADMTEAVQAG